MSVSSVEVLLMIIRSRETTEMDITRVGEVCYKEAIVVVDTSMYTRVTFQ